MSLITSHFLARRRVFLLAAVSLGLVTPVMAQTALFPQPLQLSLPNTTPTNPEPLDFGVSSIAFRDMNGDGALDVVYAIRTSLPVGNSVSVITTANVDVMLHDGTIAANVAVPTSDICEGGVGVVDVNGDGKLDVVLGCSGQILIFLGNGDGSLRAPVAQALPARVSLFDLIDLNNDGLPDLISYGTRNGVGFVNVQINSGHGLGAVVTYPVLGDAIRVVGGDFNGDGNEDLAVSGTHLTIFYGNGDGTLQAPVSLAETGLSSCIVVAELNGDGVDDIASCSTIHQDSLDVLFGSTAGGMPTIARSYALPVGSGPALTGGTTATTGALRAARLKAGGATAIFFGDTPFSMYLNDGAGNLSAPLTFSAYSSNFEIVDWNGDGNRDVLSLGTTTPATVYVSAGNGAGGFEALAPAGRLPANGVITGGYDFDQNFATRTAAGDFNGDGLADFFTQGANGVAVMLSNGDGTFTTTNFSGPTAFSFVLAGDLNKDGKADGLVLSDSSSGDVTVTACLGNGTGSVTCGTPQDLGTAGIPVGSWALADFTGDGIPDLILGVAYTGANAEQYYFARGLGNGWFATPVLETLTFGNPYLFDGGFFAVDINHDGKADLIPSQPQLTMISNGDGTFSEGGEFEVNADTILAVTDVTGDGNVDIVAVADSSTPNPEIVIYPGTATGTFPDTPITVVLPQEMSFNTTLATGDFNGDGLTDLALVGPTETIGQNGNGISGVALNVDVVVPILNQGNTTFSLDPAGPYVAPEPGAYLLIPYAGKLNRSGTGALDLALASSVSVTSLLNATNPAPPVLISTEVFASVTANPVPRGSPLTISALVSASDGSTPGGSVTLLANGNVVGSATLVQGGASVSVPTSGVAEGAYTLTARYSGDATHKPSTSGSEVVSVTGATAPTVTALNISYSGGLTQNVPITLVAGVNPAAGAGNPSGSVSFYANGKLAGSAAVAGQYAQVNFNTGSIEGGVYAVQAKYSGDANFAASTSDLLSYTLRNLTATTVQVAPGSGGPGASVTVTAHVARTATAGVPQGSITFFYSPSHQDNVLGQAQLDGNGNATLTAKVPGDASPGTYTVNAEFDPADGTFDSNSIGTATFVVTK